MYASNFHSYTHLILALGIIRKPTVWVFITSKYHGTHDIGLPTIPAMIKRVQEHSSPVSINEPCSTESTPPLVEVPTDMLSAGWYRYRSIPRVSRDMKHRRRIFPYTIQGITRGIMLS